MYEIIVNKSVGPFSIGDNISEYLADYDFDFHPGQLKDIGEWDAYEYNDGAISLCTDEGFIEAIGCKTDCYLDGYFIIGSDVDSFFEHFGIDKSTLKKDQIWLSDDERQDVYELDDLGLQIWVNDEHVIETVYVS